MSLNTLLKSLYTLPVTARKKAITSFILGHAAEQRTSFKAELDSELQGDQIDPETYSLFLKVSRDIPWSVQVLNNREEIKVLNTAVDVLESHWRTQPSEVLNAVGGNEGLVHLLGRTLPQVVSRRLFRALTSKKFADDSTQSATVDFLIRQTLPFLQNGSPAALERFSTLITPSLLLSASPPLLRALIPVIATWIKPTTWKEIAKRQPALISELIFAQLGVAPTNTWANGGKLEFPNALGTTLPVLIRSRNGQAGHWGLDFFRQFLTTYKNYLVSNTMPRATEDIQGIASGRVQSLNTLIKYYLSKTDDPIAAASELVDELDQISKREGQIGLNLENIESIFKVAVEGFERAEDWKNASGSPSKATELIQKIGRIIFVSELNLNKVKKLLLVRIEKLPLNGRFLLLDTLYKARLNTSLTETPSNPFLYPTLNSYLLSILPPEDGRAILDIAFKAKAASAISAPSSWGGGDTTRERRWEGVYSLCYSVPLQHQNDAKFAMVRAAWVGSERGPAGDCSGTPDPESVKGLVADVDNFINLAMRSKEASERTLFTKVALALCVLSRSPRLLNTKLAWALNRYAKDPETGPEVFDWVLQTDLVTEFYAGPLGLHVTAELAPKYPVEHLQAWLTEVTKVMQTLVSALKVWIGEPHTIVSGVETYRSRIMSNYAGIAISRTGWVDKVYPTMIKDLDQARNLFLTPLAALILELENLRVVEHAALFNFNASNCVPERDYNTLRFHSRISKAIIPFADELGSQREELWKTARKSLAPPDLEEDDVSRSYGSNRHLLQFTIEITNDLYRGDAHGISLEDTNAGRWNKDLLFQSRETIMATSRPDDPYNHDFGAFSTALESYLKFSRTDEEIEEKIVALLDHYGPVHGDDLRMVILQNSFVQRRIWKSEALVEKVVKEWFPKLPVGEAKEVTNWLPSLNLPELVFQNNRPPHETLKLQTTIMARSDQYEALFKGFARSYSFLGSRELQDRITYFTVAWLMTLLEAPAYPEVAEQNASALAIRGFRLHSKFLEEWPATKRNHNYRFIYPFHLFRTSQPSPADLKSLLDVLFNKFTPGTNPSAQLVAMKALGYVRNSVRFKEAIAPSMKVLEDSDFSSWHRHGLTPGLISKLRPDAAKALIGELTQFVEVFTKKQDEELKAAKEAAKTAPPLAEGEKAPEVKAVLKISTVKMAVQLARTSLERGAIDLHCALDSLSRIAKVVRHGSVSAEVVNLLIQVAKKDAIALGSEAQQSSEAWRFLKTYVDIASRLSEDKFVSENDWEAARTGAKDMPEIQTEHPLAQAFLTVAESSLPRTLTSLWAREVVTPIVVKQIANRTRWLQTAVQREGASVENVAQIEATYDGVFNVNHQFRQYVRFLALENTVASPNRRDPPSNLLQVIEHRLHAIFNRQPSFTFLDFMEKKYKDVNWWSQPYGRSLVSLLNHVKNGDNDWQQALFSVANERFKAGLVPEVNAELDKVINRLGEGLLHPANISITKGARWQRVPPFSVFGTLRNELNPSLGGDKGEWHRDLRPFLVKFLELAEGYETQENAKLTNGGASYWELILQLKTNLLPHSAVPPFNIDEQRHKIYAQAILELASTATDRPVYYNTLLSNALSSAFSDSKYNRVEDIVSIIDILTSPAESGGILPASGPERFTSFELATKLGNQWQGSINQNLALKSRMEQLQKRWVEDADGLVRHLERTMLGGVVAPSTAALDWAATGTGALVWV